MNNQTQTQKQIQKLEAQAEKLQEQIQELKKNIEHPTLPEKLVSGQVYVFNDPKSCFFGERYVLICTDNSKDEFEYILVSISDNFRERWCNVTSEPQMLKKLMETRFVYLGMFKDLYSLQEK